jgi:uncharacterized membrane protein YhaH (DUF805 family)
MSQHPDEPWFFSHEGQQKGPIPFSELQAKVNDGELDLAKDLVWKEGMANWTPVGQMREVFQVAGEPVPQPEPEPEPEPAPKPSPEPEPEPAKKQAIQQPAPQPEIREEKKNFEAEVDGANRMHYFLGVYVFPIVWMFILSLVLTALGSESGLAGFLALVGVLVPFVVVLVVVLKRFTNLAMSRWWILGNLVPLLNLWVGYRLFACPAGYGAGRKMDAIGIFLAILYWLSLIAAVATIPLMMVIAITTALDNPQLMNDPQAREQLNKALVELRDLIKAL